MGIIKEEGKLLADQLTNIGSMSKAEFWTLMDYLIKFMEERSVPEIRLTMQGARRYAFEQREAKTNKFGSGKMGGDGVEIRHLAAIPVPVMLAVKRASMQFKELPISEEEFYRGFATRYPAYRTCDLV